MSTKAKPRYKRIAQLKTAEDFRNHLKEAEIKLEFDDEMIQGPESPFRKKIELASGRTIGNSLCILPMEGWDGTSDGKPSEFTKGRWRNFAISGAKLLFGCEAVAVRHEGRANPRQLVLNKTNVLDFEGLHDLLMTEHKAEFGSTDDFYFGLQLTHSGRFCKPDKPAPKILYHHPILDKKFGLGENYPLLTDGEIEGIIQDYISAAVLAYEIGYQFVDLKHCHGYLGHEFLSAIDRKGKYGGSFENRTRFLKEIVKGIKSEAPGLDIVVRFSAFDWIPYQSDNEGIGIPTKWDGEYNYAFGCDKSGVAFDPTEVFEFMNLLKTLGIELVCVTGGSPYYIPHIQRPALFPPSDGYLPPEDPLAGVARQIQITSDIKKAFPDMKIVGSGYSYLQEWLPNVAQNVLKNGMADSVGLGRMVLSYPEMPADILNGVSPKRNKICRTFSDCTTAPRNNMISGCYPLDPVYKSLSEAAELKKIKSGS